MQRLSPHLRDRLVEFATRLIDQSSARIIVPPYANESGFWFGGGNLLEHGGELWLVGRYRNRGDSRTGLGQGERGVELAVFRSTDDGASFRKEFSFSKERLSTPGHGVLSIEGSALRRSSTGVELVVSTEKEGIDYPDAVKEHLKPGAGVWTIDRIIARSVTELANASVTPMVASSDPSHLHIKDPFFYHGREGWTLFACSHPFSWSSSNTVEIECGVESTDVSVRPGVFGRGFSWDVAIWRGTCMLDVPRMGEFRDRSVRLLFYDGGECMRRLDQHANALVRPRGYSCEELGGLAAFVDGDPVAIRLSEHKPLFISPHGTGCSRYVDVLETNDGFYATWQQSQPDGSQPLVMNFVSRADASQILS